MVDRINGTDLETEVSSGWIVWALMVHAENMKPFGPFRSLVRAEQCAINLAARADVMGVEIEEDEEE